MGSLATRDELAQILRESQKIILLSHVDPDGDALGSQITLARGLKSLGKEVQVICVGKLHDMYRWMLEEGEAEFYNRQGPFPENVEADLIVGCDFNGWDRLLGLEKVVADSGIKTAVIDHHPNLPPSADHTWVEVDYCCTGQMAWELLKDLRVEFTLNMAIPCYVTLVTDTGYFKYANTNVEGHQLASELISLGVNPFIVYQHIYEASSLERLKLMGQMLRKIQTRKEGRIVWSSTSYEECQEFGLEPEDTEGFIDIIRTLKTAEVSLFFREILPGQVKVSMRSREFDISRFAAQFNGGGHKLAAGMTLDMPLSEVEQSVVSALNSQL